MARPRRVFDLTLNEFDWLVMERTGWSPKETSMIFGFSKTIQLPLQIAHEKVRANIGFQLALDNYGPGTSLAVARGKKRRADTR